MDCRLRCTLSERAITIKRFAGKIALMHGSDRHELQDEVYPFGEGTHPSRDLSD